MTKSLCGCFFFKHSVVPQLKILTLITDCTYTSCSISTALDTDMHSALHVQYITKQGDTSCWTARVVHNQHYIDSIDLNKLHQKDAVSDRIQTHYFHVLRRQLAILRLGYFYQCLEDSIIQLAKKTISITHIPAN